MKALDVTLGTLIGLALMTSLLLGPNALFAQDAIYKWVDENGVTHFSARPPEGIEYQTIDTGTDQVRTVSPQTVGDTMDEDDEATLSEALPEVPIVEVTDPDPELVAARCEQARNNLQTYTQEIRLSKQDEDGTVRRLGEDERQNLIAEAQAFLDEWCG